MGKILIIGGCGYVGSKLFLHLSSKYSVDTLDKEYFGNRVNSKNIKKNYSNINQKFLSKYSVIILLAGHSSVAMCEDNMIPSFQNNIVNFLNLLTKIRDQKFIYASSSGIYGKTGKKSAKETDDRYKPTNYYDLTKKTIDDYSSLTDINYYGLRFGTVNGGSPNLRIDLMINKMYHTAKKTKKIHIVNGDILRPILGINDLCRAVERIIEIKEKKPGIYNLASFNKKVTQIAKETARAMRSVELVIDEKKGDNVYDFSISTTKFEKAFQFSFSDTTKSIIMSLEQSYTKSLKSERVKKIL